MPSPAAITIYLFGISAFVTGFLTLLFPKDALQILDLPDSATAVVKGNGLAAFAMGLYYNLAAWQNNRSFFTLSVPMRCLTAATLGNMGGKWGQVAIWEGTGALLTALALVFGSR